MWRPDIKVYNAYLMSPTTKPAQKGDHAGLVFPLPTPISDAFQVGARSWDYRRLQHTSDYDDDDNDCAMAVMQLPHCSHH
jgi:hypothetical protein